MPESKDAMDKEQEQMQFIGLDIDAESYKNSPLPPSLSPPASKTAVNREQEKMQFLGLFGIYAESYQIVFSWRKIFSQIALVLMLPIFYNFFTHLQVSDFLFSKNIHNENQRHESPIGAQRYENLSEIISPEWTTFWLYNFAYFTYLQIYSLFSTAAVIYTVACIYTARAVTLRNVISVVPKIWKRLIVTFLCTFAAFFLYSVVVVLILILWRFTVANTGSGAAIFYILLIVYGIGFVYLTIVWQLANVVSVVEESYGFRAMVRSKELLKGKMWIAIAIFFTLNFSLVAILILIEALIIVRIGSVNMVSGLGLAILFLFGVLIQTVIQSVFYFVCKSHHRENIDKSILLDHLEIYDLEESVTLSTVDYKAQFQILSVFVSYYIFLIIYITLNSIY